MATRHQENISIKSRDYWVKVIEMLQHNWALMEKTANGGCQVYFITDTSGIIDELDFCSIQHAKAALILNGFVCYAKDKHLQSFISKPKPPFHKESHSSGPIYSSGQFWKPCKPTKKNTIENYGISELSMIKKGIKIKRKRESYKKHQS